MDILQGGKRRKRAESTEEKETVTGLGPSKKGFFSREHLAQTSPRTSVGHKFTRAMKGEISMAIWTILSYFNVLLDQIKFVF